jgi:transposase-like protein
MERFLQRPKGKGLRGVRLFIGDQCEGLAKRLQTIFPGKHFQSSAVQFQHDVLLRLPIAYLLKMEKSLKSIYESTDRSSVSKRVVQMSADLKRLGLHDAADSFETRVWETLSYLKCPREHWRLLRSNSAQVKLLRNISERTRLVGAFSDGRSAVHLVSARLRHIETTIWREKRYWP